jgi:hypothetical protein
MRTEKLIDQLELYSNAIVGFMVAQSITFSFTFGTNVAFGCEITRYKLLAAALLAHFVLSSFLAGVVLDYVARRIVELSEQNQSIVRTIYKAKTGLVILFALIPAGLLISFGLLADTSKGRCKDLAKVAVLAPAELGAAVMAPLPRIHP